MTAAGGYGKSALAVKFTQQLTPNWRLLWVSFIQPYSLAQFGRWLLEQLGRDYDEKWDEETLTGQIVAGLIAEPCLLVLDNMETVIPAEGKSVYGQFLSQWLGNGGNSKLLLTSREQPTFSPNLQPRCYWLPLKGLAEADAIRLVTEDYGLTGTEEELAQFVNQMGRHPLLMQLVSSWMREELGEGVCVTEAENLGLDLFTVEGYHRDTETCVREVVAASLARLSARLGDSLKRLSVLRGIFDLGLAQGLIAEVTEAELRYLARLSLLQEFPPEPKEGKQRRFEFLPLIQTLVQQQADSELLRSAHQSALDYFLAHLPAPPWESLEDLTAYLEAFYHAVELGQRKQAFEILNEERGGEGKNKSVNYFLEFQGFNRQLSGLYESLISPWPLEQQQQSVFGKALSNLGLCYYSLGNHKKAIAYHQQALEIMQKIGDRSGIVDSFNSLGICHYLLGKYEEAIDYHQQSLEIQQASENQLGIAKSFNNLGLCYQSLGDYKKAISYYEQSLKIRQASGNRSGIAKENQQNIDNQSGMADSFNNLGNCYNELKKHKEAITYHKKSLKIRQDIEHQFKVADSFDNLGNCYKELKNHEEAIAYYKKSLKIRQDIGNQSGVAVSFNNLGDYYHELGDYEKAIDYHQESLKIKKKFSNQPGIAISLHNIGDTLIKLEQYSEAESKIQESLVISQEINYKYLIAHSLKVLAEIAHQTNQPQLALTHCQNALSLSQELGIPLVKDCEELLAKIQENLGENQ
jgi:tetratricopeptide (TPR) repeat protein